MVVRHPLRMDRIVALSPLARTPGWSPGINQAARRALHPLVAPGVWTGRNHPASAWEGRAPITHLQAARTPELLASEILDHHALRHWLARPAQEWTERRFDPLDWVYQSLAYDAHDVGKTSSTQENTALALALANNRPKHSSSARDPIYTIRSISRNGRPRRFPAVSMPRSTRTGGPYLQCGRYRKRRAVAPVRPVDPLGIRK